VEPEIFVVDVSSGALTGRGRAGRDLADYAAHHLRRAEHAQAVGMVEEALLRVGDPGVRTRLTTLRDQTADGRLRDRLTHLLERWNPGEAVPGG